MEHLISAYGQNGGTVWDTATVGAVTVRSHASGLVAETSERGRRWSCAAATVTVAAIPSRLPPRSGGLLSGVTPITASAVRVPPPSS